LIIPLSVAVAAATQTSSSTQSANSESIVVTGERVRRSIKDTASSVSVATSRDIEAASADRVEQILATIPNVQPGHGSQGPAIRGLDTTGALQALPFVFGGSRSRTSLIVDGRRQTYNEFVFGSMPVWDLDRVEVFRTPQATTQGQNSIAGAIFAYTKDPTFTPEVRARLIGGNYYTGEMSALASGPLSSDVAMRFAGDLRYNHTTSRIADRAAGADPNHDAFGLARLKLLATPREMPGTKLELTYAHLQSQAPQVVGVSPPFHKRRDLDGFYGTFRNNIDSLTSDLHVEPMQGLTLDTVATAGDGRFQRFATPGLGQHKIHSRDWSVETIGHWSPGSRPSVTGGISYSHVGLDELIDLSVLSGVGRFHDDQESLGIFGEANVSLVPRLILTAGLRYQRDRQRRNGALGTPSSAISLQYDRKFDSWLPKLSLAYDVGPNVRVGALALRAYNPGGTTLRFDTGAPDNFEAERLWDYELFVRATMANGTITAEANLFYESLRDAQRAQEILIRAPNGQLVPFADLFNLPKARSAGFETRLDWHASRRFVAAVTMGLLNTKILRAEGAYAPYKGKEFQRAPHFSMSASFDWRPLERLRLFAQLRHNGEYFSDDLNNPLLAVKGSTKVDTRAEWSAGKTRLFAYARNAFDKFYMLSLYNPDGGEAGEPREVGAGIEAAF
jgi:outer membrane receptor protein involved in Fe transport